MPSEIEIRRTAAGRVFVVLHPTCEITREAILKLLTELGIDEAAVVFLLPDAIASCRDMDDAVVLFPVDEAVCNAPELEAAGRQCGQAGARVVVVFGEALAYEGLHPVADKFGTQCGWSALQLAPFMNSPTVAQPMSSSGIPVARPKSSQVPC